MLYGHAGGRGVDVRTGAIIVFERRLEEGGDVCGGEGATRRRIEIREVGAVGLADSRTATGSERRCQAREIRHAPVPGIGDLDLPRGVGGGGVVVANELVAELGDRVVFLRDEEP